MPGNPLFYKSRLGERFAAGLGRLGDPCGWPIGAPRRCWRPQPDVQLRKHGLRIKGDEPSPSETPESIFFGESPEEGGFERDEKLGLGDVGNSGLDEVLDLGAVRLLQDAVQPNIERLSQMR